MKRSTSLKTDLILMMIKEDISFFKVISLIFISHIIIYGSIIIPFYIISMIDIN